MVSSNHFARQRVYETMRKGNTVTGRWNSDRKQESQKPKSSKWLNEKDNPENLDD